MARIWYSHALVQELVDQIRSFKRFWPYHEERYEPGKVLSLNVTTAWPEQEASLKLVVDKFVGGGFAGQVYRCQLTESSLSAAEGDSMGLRVGGTYAVKVLLPPSRFSQIFRNTVYTLAFQAPFSAQTLKSACRSGLLWPKVLRLAAGEAFGDQDAVADTYASFYDDNLKAFGEVREWVEGRGWRLESDNQPHLRKDWRSVKPQETGSPEYVAKHQFMDRLVRMLEEMGARELSRQYAWSTLKSQPNALKRYGDEDDPAKGLCAVDFRAGLALLPYLPMSPGDFVLILKGLRHGSLTQFDRCDFSKLRAYITQHPEAFRGQEALIDALEHYDAAYRRSMPDWCHQGWRLLWDGALRCDVREGLIASYRALGMLDEQGEALLRSNRLAFGCFRVAGLVPFLGVMIRRLIGHGLYRQHIKAWLTQWAYLREQGQVTAMITAIRWHRAGRISEPHARRLAHSVPLYWLERLTVGFLPIFLHRRLAEPWTVWHELRDGFVYVRRFLRDEAFRIKWLEDQVEDGRKEGMLTDAEAADIRQSVSDPFIGKYLKSVGVHLAFLPVTQVVSVLVGGIVAVKVWMSTNDWKQAGLAFGGILALFQIIPISPGSICRGAYVVYLMIRERNFRDYVVAAPLSFVKYIGYLAFPLQMTTSYPVLAQFMGGRWASSSVHIIPVFGEKGAWLEHFVFDLFFNRSRVLGRKIGKHTRGILSIWMVATIFFGGVGIWLLDAEGQEYAKNLTNIVIAVLCLGVLPRVLFYPVYHRKRARSAAKP